MCSQPNLSNIFNKLILAFLLKVTISQEAEVILPSGSFSIVANVSYKATNDFWLILETINIETDTVSKFLGEIEIIKDNLIDMKIILFNGNLSYRLAVTQNHECFEMENMLDYSWNSDKLSKTSIRLINTVLMMGPYYYYSYLAANNHNQLKSIRTLQLPWMIVNETKILNFKFNNTITPRVALNELASIDVTNPPGNDCLITIKIIKLLNHTIENQHELEKIKMINIPDNGVCDALTRNSSSVRLSIFRDFDLRRPFHLKFNETLVDTNYNHKTFNEYDVISLNQVSMVKRVEKGVEYKSISDHSLGISFISSDLRNHCFIRLMNTNVTSIYGLLSFKDIFWANVPPQLYGHYDGNHTSYFSYESIEYHVTYYGQEYGKIVTTHLMDIKSWNMLFFMGMYNPLRDKFKYIVERKFYYRKEGLTLKSSNIPARTERRIFYYLDEIYDPDSYYQFVINQNAKCFTDETNSVILKLKLIEMYDLLYLNTLLSSDANFKISQKKQLGVSLRLLITSELHISYLRIPSIAFEFTNNTHITVKIKILEVIDYLKSVKTSDAAYSMNTSGNCETFRPELSCLLCKQVAERQLHLDNGSICLYLHDSQPTARIKLIQDVSLKDLRPSLDKLNGSTLLLYGDTFAWNGSDSDRLDRADRTSYYVELKLVSLIIWLMMVFLISYCCFYFRRNSSNRLDESISLEIIN